MMAMGVWEYLADPLFRAPLWGTLFMCIASSLMGVVILLKKRSLIAETLSHAAYPGILLASSLFALLFPQWEEGLFLSIFAGGFASSFLGLKAIEWLEKRGRVPSDAALCFVLSLFFGVGVVVASAMQASLPKWYQGVQILLFGQAATMTDLHIFLYSFLALLVIAFLCLSFRPLQAILFDPAYATSLGIRTLFFERMISWLLLFSLLVGMRSVGIVLVSGMAVAPAVAARQFTDRLQTLFFLTALFGAASGLIGNVLSVELSLFLSRSGERLSLPTGPIIVLVAASFALFSLALAPRRGLFFRLGRIVSFRLRCLEENILKGIWKKGPLFPSELKRMHRVLSPLLSYVFWRLRWQGWIRKNQTRLELTFDGRQKATSIIRLHRLWELYLAEELGLRAERVHRNAEEMEHILTPDLEERLTRLLSNPKRDPHHQPIPEK